MSRGTDAEGKASEPGRSSRYANICKGRLAHLQGVAKIWNSV